MSGYEINMLKSELGKMRSRIEKMEQTNNHTFHGGLKDALKRARLKGELMDEIPKRLDYWEKELMRIGVNVLPAEPMPDRDSEDETGEHKVPTQEFRPIEVIGQAITNTRAVKNTPSHLIRHNPDKSQPPTQKPLTIISLGNEHHHPSPEEMDSVREQLVDMGIQDFLVVPYQVAIHQASVPMVAEEKETVDIKQVSAPPQSKEISAGHEIEQIQENLYKCRELLNSIKGSLHWANADIVSDRLLKLDQYLHEALKPLEQAEGRAIQKYIDQLGESPQADIAGALFDFAAYLTTLEVPMTIGSAYNANTILDHLTVWSKERGLSLKDANVEKWNNTSSTPEEQSPSKADTVSKLIDVASESFRHYTSKPAGIPGILVKEIENEEAVKSETITKIKNEVIEIVRESLKNLVGSPMETKVDTDGHVSIDVYPTIPLEYIDVKIELEENINVF